MLLADVVAHYTGIPHFAFLERIKNTKRQLTIVETFLERIKYTQPELTIIKKVTRERNVRGAFRIRHKNSLHGKNVILLDDVCTTGATVNECSKVLKKAGALKIMVLTTAYAE